MSASNQMREALTTINNTLTTLENINTSTAYMIREDDNGNVNITGKTSTAGVSSSALVEGTSFYSSERSYNGYILPLSDGTTGQVLSTDGGKNLSFTTVGDVSSTNNITDDAIVVGDGGSKGVQDSGIFIGTLGSNSKMYVSNDGTGVGYDFYINGGDGNGTDKTGGDLNINGGAGTGTGSGGDIVFSGSDTSTTGSSLNGLVERVRLTATGNVGIGTDSPVTTLQLVSANSFTSVSDVTAAFSSSNYPMTSAAIVSGPNVGGSVSDAIRMYMGTYAEGGVGSGGFIQASAVYGSPTQDNAINLALNPRGGKIGIGTNTPVTTLQLVSANSFTSVSDVTAAFSSSNYPMTSAAIVSGPTGNGEDRVRMYMGTYHQAGVASGVFIQASELYGTPIQDNIANLALNPRGGRAGIGTGTPYGFFEVVSGNTTNHVASMTSGGNNSYIRFRTNGTTLRSYIGYNDGRFEISNYGGEKTVIWQNLGINTTSTQGKVVISGFEGESNISLYTTHNIFCNSLTQYSDDRIKENETYLNNATETLMKLKPQAYTKYSISQKQLEQEILEYNDKTDELNDKKIQIETLISEEENKDNLVKLNDDLENVNLEIQQHTSRGTPMRTSQEEFGLISQEVYYNAPELRRIVKLSEDANPVQDVIIPDDPQVDLDYDNLGWGSKNSGIDYVQLIPYLIKMNQEQQVVIEDLKARIEVLESA